MEKIFKDKNAVTPEYVQKLKQYLLDNQAVYFSDDNKATSFSDMVRFPKLKTDRHHLCMPSEPLLIDRSHEGEHMYCICTLSENNKITSQIPVVRISEFNERNWRNGYFLLPVL